MFHDDFLFLAFPLFTEALLQGRTFFIDGIPHELGLLLNLLPHPLPCQLLRLFRLHCFLVQQLLVLKVFGSLLRQLVFQGGYRSLDFRLFPLLVSCELLVSNNSLSGGFLLSLK